MRGIQLALLCTTMLAAIACHRPPPQGDYNLILFSLDTLRADRLGSYGYKRPTSPRIDSLAARGALFRNTVSQSSWTLPSHMTMLTGLFPSSHGVTLPDQTAGPTLRLLAEIFRDAGYRTVGNTDGGFVKKRYGFDRGFDHFTDRESPFRDRLNWLDGWIRGVGSEERYFAFLHTYIIYCPYDPAPEFARQFVSEQAEPFDSVGKCGNPHLNEMDLNPGQVRYLSDLYDASIREADTLLGEFLDRLDGLGKLENTIVVITSDHGEEFHEHGQIGHERTLYRETLMVPLVILGPGVSPHRIQEMARLVDLAPTVLALTGVRADVPMEGRNLAGLLNDAPTKNEEAPAPAVSELDRELVLRSLMTPDLHLIVDVEKGAVQLFDPATDPAEQHNLAVSRPEDARRMQSELDSALAGMGGNEPMQGEAVSERELEELRALGYVQ